MIYFIKQNSSNSIRIGIANNLEDRVQQLQAGSSKKLTCIKQFKTESDFKTRLILHNFFSDVRIEKSNWFNTTPEMKIFLKKIDDSKFYHSSKIKYLLDKISDSTNRFKIKLNVNQIKQQMNIRQCNQSMLAKKIGTSKQAVSLALLKKQTSLNTAKKISKVLQCNPREIILNGKKHQAC